jgi:hypothetical protein
MGRAPKTGTFARPGKADESLCLDILRSMGIADLAGKSYLEISGGERQQVLIARAIAQQPLAILFDEPTAHLDYGNQHRVLRRIKDMAQEGFSVIITTHNPDHALLLGDKAAVVSRDGHITQGDVRDIITNTLGPDAGGDVSDHWVDIVMPLCSFLNHTDGRLKVVLYTLEPSHTSSLATVARAFGSKVRLGSAWWLNDTPIGMKRQLEYIGSVDVWYDFAGMVSDSRKILSYASRFEMFRRVLADVLGDAVEMGKLPYLFAENLAVKMAYEEPKAFFNL